MDKAVQTVKIKSNKEVQYSKLKFWYETETSQFSHVEVLGTDEIHINEKYSVLQ